MIDAASLADKRWRDWLWASPDRKKLDPDDFYHATKKWLNNVPPTDGALTNSDRLWASICLNNFLLLVAKAFEPDTHTDMSPIFGGLAGLVVSLAGGQAMKASGFAAAGDVLSFLAALIPIGFAIPPVRRQIESERKSRMFAEIEVKVEAIFAALSQ